MSGAATLQKLFASEKATMAATSDLAKEMLSFFEDTSSKLTGAKDSFVTLDDKDAVINASNEKVQVLWFFAEWCGHCQNMRAEWETAVTKAAKTGTATWHKVDCAAAGLTFAHDMEVQSFPTIMFVNKGKFEQYTGAREADALVEFAMQREGGNR